MAEDKHTYSPLVEHQWIFAGYGVNLYIHDCASSCVVWHVQLCVSVSVYTAMNLYGLVCVTFHCFQVCPKVPLQFTAFSLVVVVGGTQNMRFRTSNKTVGGDTYRAC